jgi:ATPase family associated with various cellular activities (AAA)
MSGFSSLPRAVATHFQLNFFGAVLHLREHASEERFPFLRDYCAEPDAIGVTEAAVWDAALAEWEADVPLPLTRLTRTTGITSGGVRALFVIGLVDEDARFGSIFEEFTGHPRPTSGLLHAWWPTMRPCLRRLVELGLAETVNADAPRADSPLRVPAVAWDAIRGDPPGTLTPWVRHRAAETLPHPDDLVLARPTLDVVRRAPAVLASGAVTAIIVRGPATSGRRTVLAAIARTAGWGVLEISGLDAGDHRWRQIGPLATLLGAMPVAIVEVPPGEVIDLPALDGWNGPLGVVLGRRGGIGGPPADHAVTIALDIPDPSERARHWADALDQDSSGLATRFRMTGGNIRRTAALARAEAALAGRDRPTSTDIARGARALHVRLLDTFATRVTTENDWSRVAVRPETMRELHLLEARCRHRERIGELVGASNSTLTKGVRALLTGPSGTGKTLAARTLAGVLAIDLYRIDLSTVVNKYLGETEKNLERLFSLAEEADAALLLDEGDALMTRRTDVHTSNDRYANLETNFLLQRLESFEGILLITTNGGERIDEAFCRRMDMVIDFGLPDEFERWSIWNLHLPVEHDVSDDMLGELATRCALTGGQIRNAVLHASVLALEGSGVLGTPQLEAAVRREYAKTGQLCPLAAEACVG